MVKRTKSRGTSSAIMKSTGKQLKIVDIEHQIRDQLIESQANHKVGSEDETCQANQEVDKQICDNEVERDIEKLDQEGVVLGSVQQAMEIPKKIMNEVQNNAVDNNLEEREWLVVGKKN
ncbi:hypothetical protein ACFE04_009814 [Oxalis oulophora]